MRMSNFTYVIKKPIDYRIVDGLFPGFTQTLKKQEFVVNHHAVTDPPATIEETESLLRAIDDWHTNVTGLGNIGYHAGASPLISFVVFLTAPFEEKRFANSNYELADNSFNFCVYGDLRDESQITPGLVLTWFRFMEDLASPDGIKGSDELAIQIDTQRKLDEPVVYSGVTITNYVTTHRVVAQVGHGTICPAAFQKVVDEYNKYGAQAVYESEYIRNIIRQNMELCWECGLFLDEKPVEEKLFTESEYVALEKRYLKEIEDIKTIHQTELNDLKSQIEALQAISAPKIIGEYEGGLNNEYTDKFNEIVKGKVEAETSQLKSDLVYAESLSIKKVIAEYKTNPNEDLTSFLKSNTMEHNAEMVALVESKTNEALIWKKKLEEEKEKNNSTKNKAKGSLTYGAFPQMVNSAVTTILASYMDLQFAAMIGTFAGQATNTLLSIGFSWWKKNDNTEIPELAEKVLADYKAK